MQLSFCEINYASPHEKGSALEGSVAAYFRRAIPEVQRKTEIGRPDLCFRLPPLRFCW